MPLAGLPDSRCPLDYTPRVEPCERLIDAHGKPVVLMLIEVPTISRQDHDVSDCIEAVGYSIGRVNCRCPRRWAKP
jgi:hypothetical protein